MNPSTRNQRLNSLLAQVENFAAESARLEAEADAARAARDAMIQAAAREGASLAMIGARCGLSRSGVHLIVRADDLDT